MNPSPLSHAIDRASTHALGTGALLPLGTESIRLEEGGLDFSVHWLSSLALKDAAKLLNPGPKAKDFNPFLPYEQDLFVADLSATHVALLNKFPLFARHILLVTRIFEEQLSALTVADFDALEKTLGQLDGLVFYNGGPIGGASQRHKHLQWVPNGTFSIEAVLRRNGESPSPRRLAVFPFRHAFLAHDASASAGQRRDAFYRCCEACGISLTDGMLPPYNLLAGRDWMLVVPRSVEHWQDPAGDDRISMNAMSFAGSIFVRKPEQIDAVRKAGPMNLLNAVTYPD